MIKSTQKPAGMESDGFITIFVRSVGLYEHGYVWAMVYAWGVFGGKGGGGGGGEGE